MTQYTPVPAVPSPSWLSKKLAAQGKKVDDLRTELLEKRQDVESAKAEAAKQDLTTFTPVRLPSHVLDQSELVFRREFDALIRDVMEETRTYDDQCFDRITKAEESVTKRLIEIGYEKPIDGEPARGTFRPDWIARHPSVLQARGHKDEVSGFLSQHGEVRRENAVQIQALTAKLTAMRDTVLA